MPAGRPGDSGIDVLAIRSVLSPDAHYLFRAPGESSCSMYVRASAYLRALPDCAGSIMRQFKNLANDCDHCARGYNASVGWAEVSWVMMHGEATLTGQDIKRIREDNKRKRACGKE